MEDSKSLYIPLGLKEKNELWDGFGKEEAIKALIFNIVTGIIDALIYLSTKNLIFSVVFILVSVGGSVTMFTKDTTNLSVVEQHSGRDSFERDSIQKEITFFSFPDYEEEEESIETENIEEISNEQNELINYKFNPEDEIGVGGLKTKFRNNVEAIKTLKVIEKVNRLATKEVQSGIIAFITSKGTMDKENDSVRRYLSERADLIGAIRLPNTAFKDNANTEVTTDIIFLQKRERLSVKEADWLKVEKNEDGSNSMTEMYVMQRYLQPNTLKERGINHFDEWAANFGEVVSSLELAPEGTGYRIRNRFSKFTNLPELMSMFKNVADTQTADMLNLPVPKLKEDKYQLISSEPSEFVKKEMENYVLRAEAIRSGAVKPNQDNMLKITNEARLLGTDPRLIDEKAINDPDSKVNKCIDNIFNEYKDSEEIKGTQIVFCDVGTPNKDGRFSIYDYIKEELINKGIPEDEICFIHDAKTEVQREKLFSDMRYGNKRIILGSTPKMGTGTNIQDRLVALHHLDCPYRPSDIEQREGRILRQGNMNEEVNIYRYVTKNTFDSYLWQIVEQKQKFISQVMTSKSIARNCEDIDETVLSFAEVKALATGDPRIKEKMDIDNDVARLRVLKSSYDNQRYTLEDNFIYKYPRLIKEEEQRLECIIKDIEKRNMNTTEKFSININGKLFDEREKAGTILKSLYNKVEPGKELHIGTYQGFNLLLRKSMIYESYEIIIHGNLKYRVDLGDSPHGNMVRIENIIKNLEDRMTKSEEIIENHKKNLENSKLEYEKPFPYEEEYKTKLARQFELNQELDLGRNNEDVIDEDENEEEEEVEFDVAVGV